MYSRSCRSLVPMAFAVIASVGFSSVATAEINWQRSPQSAIDAAQKSKKPILVYVATSWCHYCEKMKHETWSNHDVSQAVSSHYETLILDGDRNQQVVEQLRVTGFPATLLFTPEGQFIAKHDGYMSSSEAIQWLGAVRR